MIKNDCSEIVKKEFDFGWKAGRSGHVANLLALEHQKGDILDVGCGTCQLYNFLIQREWTGQYTGIDGQRYEDYPYPPGIKLLVNDATKVTFPKTDTVVLYWVLEHVKDPCALLSKSIESCQENVLLCVPKRNEALWELGVVEYHQLDKTHQHCGFAKEEVSTIVRSSGGKIQSYKELTEKTATLGVSLWNSEMAKRVVFFLSRIFSSKIFYENIWCEVIKE
jgi:2-polyprenyl-3-methyl-5-hydroxy-6-metoxy-1,4-benzoquinol methylase